jgi:hypothetical protein
LRGSFRRKVDTCGYPDCKPQSKSARKVTKFFCRTPFVSSVQQGLRTSAFYELGDINMGKRDDLIAQYADDLKNKCGMTPDMDLLTKVTIGCGPSIYDADASTVASSQPGELETVKDKFLVKKLGLADGPELMEAINKVVETYGKSERNKYRAVVYYMLTKHFGKESVYG